ncbi:TPA: transporter [Yersinia enterocolitica]|nr:transporter [Yersinia enterocolitica]
MSTFILRQISALPIFISAYSMSQPNAITPAKVPGPALPLFVAGAFFMENLDFTAAMLVFTLASVC